MTKTSEGFAKISKALADAQGEIKNPEKNKTANAGSFKYKYADIADVLTTILPVLSKHKIAVVQPTVVKDSALFINTRLCHESGEWIESTYPVCSINGDHQKMGAAMTYARRYALCSIIGVAADEDIDGTGAATVDKPATPDPQKKPTGPSKADSRPVYDKLYKGITEIMGSGTYDDLVKWGDTIKKELVNIHPDWHSQLQVEFSNAMREMKKATQEADRMVEGARNGSFPEAELEREPA